jgi:hypothetical protein
MEARMFRLWQTLVYVGGWAVVNAALLWLVLHWESLTRVGKLALGSIPAFTTFALAGLMWRAERFRLFFVALVVGVLGTPLLVGVWLHEFKIAAFVPEARRGLELIQEIENALTNDQILYTAIVWVLVAGAVMAFTRTATHSAQTVLAAFLCYSAYLLRHGLRPLAEQEQWAEIAVRCIPLLLATCAISVLLIKRQDRHYQAPSWIYFSAALLLAITLAISLHGLSEWTELSQTLRKPTSFLLLSLAGVTQATVGLAARSLLRHRCRLASLGVIFCGLATVLVGFALAGWRHTWPEEWWQIALFGKAVPFPLVALPAAALLISLLACRFQMFVFLLVGLIGLAFSIHLLGDVYFRDVSAWPKGLMMVGAGCFFLALYKELRRTRGNTIDDAVTQVRL